MIRVIVQRPPNFRIKPKQIYITKLGATIEMHCDARDPTSDDQIAPVDWVRVRNLVDLFLFLLNTFDFYLIYFL